MSSPIGESSPRLVTQLQITSAYKGNTEHAVTSRFAGSLLLALPLPLAFRMANFHALRVARAKVNIFVPYTCATSRLHLHLSEPSREPCRAGWRCVRRRSWSPPLTTRRAWKEPVLPESVEKGKNASKEPTLERRAKVAMCSPREGGSCE